MITDSQTHVKAGHAFVSVKQIGAEAMRRPKEYYRLRDL